MQAIHITDTATEAQIKGMGNTAVKLNLLVNVSELKQMPPEQRFMLSLTIVYKGYTYYYTNIYTSTDIQENGDLIIGEVTIIGPLDRGKADIKAKVIYIDNV